MDALDGLDRKPRFAHIVYIGPGPVQAAPVTDDTPVDWDDGKGMRRRGADLEWDDEQFDEIVLLEYDLESLRQMGFTEAQARILHWRLCQVAKGGEYLSLAEFNGVIGRAAREPNAPKLFPWLVHEPRGLKQQNARPRRTRPRARQRSGARRAAGIRSGTDPGDDPPGSNPPRLTLAPKPGATYEFGVQARERWGLA